ncbi:MAG: alpha/beta hydrolase-fold protein [Cyclobacteriaceae bacterium]
MTCLLKVLNTSQAKSLFIFLLTIITSLSSILAQERGSEEHEQRSNLELPNIKVISIEDTQNDRQYELYIKLPEKYAESGNKKHPVIYYADAIWHVEMLSGSAEYIMEDAILVGISWQKDIDKDLLEERGAHVSRFRDYTIRPHSNPEIQAKYQLGQASDHLEFIRKDVIPYVEENYQTDPQNRTYFGYSASGLFGAYILSSRPEAFKNYLIGSPSLRGDIPLLTELIADKNLKANVFITNGSKEQELGEYANEFVAILENKNDKTFLITHEEMSGDHQTAFPRMAVRSVGWLSELGKPSSDYFGETPPDLIPQLFEPEIVSPEGLFEGGSFSPDGTEYYFSRKNGKYEERTFFVIRYENGSWQNESETDIKWPKFSASGDTIYRGNKYRILTDSGWSEYKSLGAPFSDKHIMGISFSENGTSYFDEIEFDESGKPDTVGAISYSRLINGTYEPRQKLGKEINTGTWIAHPHIAPDESYLIWDVRREDGYGGSDIYISFRDKNGSWLPAMNMGDKINTSLSESGAHVSDDGKYLFFTRGQWEIKEDGSENWVGKPYWVDAQVIENLRPK